MINALFVLAALQAAPGPVPIAGRVVRLVGGDTLVVPDALVLLHRVGAEVQGVIDSVRSDGGGNFRFRASLDSGAVLLLSARHEGIEYFAAPIAPELARQGVVLDVQVADRDPDAVVQVAARHLIVGGPAADGTRDVVDLVVLRNTSGMTRAMPDTATPTWRLALPPHVANVRIGDADFAAELLDLHGDTLFVHAPIPPGERQFFLEYQIVPSTRTVEIPLDQPIDAMTLLAEEDALEVGVPMQRTDVQEVEGRRFVRWTGRTDGATAALVLRLPGQAAAPAWLLPALVGGFGLLLLAVMARVTLLQRR